MVSQPVDVSIRKQTPEDDPQVIDLYRRAAPDLPGMTVDEYRGFLASIPEDVPRMRLVAERDGNFVAQGTTIRRFWVGEVPSYQVDVVVHPDQRGHGIGTRVADRVLKTTAEFDAARIFADVREGHQAGTRFVERYGFSPTGHVGRLSRLDVDTVEFDDGYAVLEEQLASEGIRVATLADLGMDETVLRPIHGVDLVTAADEPASEPFQPSFELWRDMLVKQPGVTADAVWIAFDRDTPIGLTKLRRQGPDAAWHEGMGVLRQYRGRGIARLLKRHSILWAGRNGLRALFTGNDINNPRMYAINIRLGYQPLPGHIEYTKEATVEK